MKTLILYYSYENTTKKIADYIQKTINCDIERITVIDEPNKSGLKKFLWGGGQVFQKKAPKIAKLQSNIDDYDLIYLGTPVWASSYTPAIRTLIEEYNFINKTVKIFYTDLGGPGRIEKDFKKALNTENIDFLGLTGVNKNFENQKSKIENFINE